MAYAGQSHRLPQNQRGGWLPCKPLMESALQTQTFLLNSCQGTNLSGVLKIGVASP